MDDILFLLLGLIAVVGEIATLYKILKKRYGKETIVITGRIISIYVGSGLKKHIFLSLRFRLMEI